MAYATINPYTGETLKTFPDATDAEVEQAIAAAHEAFLSGASARSPSAVPSCSVPQTCCAPRLATTRNC